MPCLAPAAGVLHCVQDDQIDYNELSAVILCEDILEFALLVPDKKMVSQEKAVRA